MALELGDSHINVPARTLQLPEIRHRHKVQTPRLARWVFEFVRLVAPDIGHRIHVVCLMNHREHEVVREASDFIYDVLNRHGLTVRPNAILPIDDYDSELRYFLSI